MKNNAPKWVALAMVAGLFPFIACAQEAMSIDQLLNAPAQTIASHMDPVPRAAVPQAKSRRGAEILGYSIEQVDLGQPREVAGPGVARSIVTRRAWRVRVYTNNLQVRSSPITVWIGDKQVGRGVESEDLSSVTAITTDASLFENGKPVGFSYQSDPDARLLSKAPLKLKSTP